MDPASALSLAPSITPWLGTFPANALVESFTASIHPDLQTAETIGRMARHVAASTTDAAVLRALRDAQADVAGLTATEKANRIFYWIKTHVAFREDPPEDELLIAPPALLAMRPPAGDCDDFAMLVATMLVAARVPASFVTVAADPEDRSKFSHVYVEAQTDQGPLALDASHGPYPGWSAVERGLVFRLQRWPVLLTQHVRRPRAARGLGRLGAPMTGYRYLGSNGDYGGETAGASSGSWSQTFSNIFTPVSQFVTNLVRLRTPTFQQTPTTITTYPSGQIPVGGVFGPGGATVGGSSGLLTLLLIGGLVIVVASAAGGRSR
jgi:hypothetical protein